MQRRNFMKRTVAAGSVAVLANTFEKTTSAQTASKKFSVHFAPHNGMFAATAGTDIIDQIKYAADLGFTAWEDNGMPERDVATQEKIGQTLDRLGMTMGVFVAYAVFDRPTFARPDADSTKEILAKMKESVEIAKRVNAKWMTVVPGSVDQQVPKDNGSWNKYGGRRLAPGYQEANVIDMLRRCTDILEPHDLVMVLEPLNWYANHGGTYLARSDHAYSICRAVDSPACKILFDIYHQQITEGNLIPNIDQCWSEIAYFQAGDNPGRKEPGSGEINYKKVFQHIADKGFTGVIGMEHGNTMNGVDGETHLVDSYRKVEPSVK